MNRRLPPKTHSWWKCWIRDSLVIHPFDESMPKHVGIHNTETSTAASKHHRSQWNTPIDRFTSLWSSLSWVTRNTMTTKGVQPSEFCQNFACELQTCLDSKRSFSKVVVLQYQFFCLENAFNPDKCEKVLNKLRNCCLDHGAQSPVVCSGFPTSRSPSTAK